MPIPRIIYFNINYSCNQRCVFCFSNSTGRQKEKLSKKDICERLNKKNPTEDDRIIINGGEPTLHSEFYDIINSLTVRYPASIFIYTNGTNIDIDKLSSLAKLKFFIPIHGNSDIHNAVTRLRTSFSSVLRTLKTLQKYNIRYSIKFIVNTGMINSNFDIKSFLIENGLTPEEIFLARLNNTDKARFNNVALPVKKNLIDYLSNQFSSLSADYKLKFLDFPFCYMPFCKNKNISIFNMGAVFYFNDIEHNMLEKSYYKEIMIGNDCDSCYWNKNCKLLRTTYLTLEYENNSWRMDLE